MNFEVCLHVTNRVGTRLNGLILEDVPKRGDDDLRLCRDILQECRDGSL